jgi:hypothetical protein
MIELEYEMTYAETIEGPLGPTTGLIRSSERFLAALGSGEATEFEDQYMRIAPHLASPSWCTCRHDAPVPPRSHRQSRPVWTPVRQVWGSLRSTAASSSGEAIPTLANTFRGWLSTGRGLRNSCAATCAFAARTSAITDPSRHAVVIAGGPLDPYRGGLARR